MSCNWLGTLAPRAATLAGAVLAAVTLSGVVARAEEPVYQAEFVFPLDAKHNHAPGVVETPEGDLLVSWYRGSGERQSDDVAVWGARRRRGETAWSEPVVWADTPLFPDCNTALWIDGKQRLWLFWPLIIDNQWDSCLTHYRVASQYNGDGPPQWDWQAVIPLIPQNFNERMLAVLDQLEQDLAPSAAREKMFAQMVRTKIKEKLNNRLGWQPRCKPTVLPSGRILLPLYTDTYSVSLMAISDDGGASWYASEPLVGYGAIQPAVVRRNDGTLVAYMRENGPVNKIRTAESRDEGITWGPVGAIDLPNPGSGLDALRLASGRWLLVYNDTLQGRSSLAVSLSDDEGRTWTHTRHLEKQAQGAYHYPTVIQGADGLIHCVYSYFTADGKTMKHAQFNEAWVDAGD